jgi:conjugative transfer region lipoprotein (TIGR03751 family)
MPEHNKQKQSVGSANTSGSHFRGVATGNSLQSAATLKGVTLSLLLLCGGSLLTGCATSKDEILPPGDHTMLQLWNGEEGDNGSSGPAQTSVRARDTLRRPLTVTESQATLRTDESYSRTQASEISQQFPRLPNPDMVMYLYPHLADGNTPVPGYSTVFSFYSRTQYAMPGERTEAL